MAIKSPLCFASLTMTEGPCAGMDLILVGHEEIIAEITDFLTSISVNLEEGKIPICRPRTFTECGNYRRQVD